MVLLVGTLFIFGALFLTFAAFGSMSGQSRGVARSLEMLESLGGAPSELTADLEKPFGERVLDPLLKRFQTLGRRVSGADQEDRIRQKLDRAGNPPGGPSIGCFPVASWVPSSAWAEPSTSGSSWDFPCPRASSLWPSDC